MIFLAFVLGYVLSFEAMVASFIPGVIALTGSSTGIFICACRFCDSKKQQKNE